MKGWTVEQSSGRAAVFVTDFLVTLHILYINCRSPIRSVLVSRQQEANSSLFVFAGMIPLARELIKNGTFVVLAANEVPALNDITAAELKVLLRDCGKLDKLLGRAGEEEVITVVSSGNSLPIIDLTKVRKCSETGKAMHKNRG